LEALDDTTAPPRGLWWKSLIVAWLVTRPLGLITAVTDWDPPDAVGLAVFAGAWAATWYLWRRRSERGQPAGSSSVLRPMQRITGAFALAVLLFGNVVVALGADDLKRTDVAIGPVVAAVVAAALVSLVGGRLLLPKLRPDAREPAELVGQYRSRFFGQLAWAEMPVLLAFGAVFLVGEGWIYVIGLVPSLAGFALALPTGTRVHRDNDQLRASGSTLDLVAALDLS
jgi:hypothetical protein